MTNIPHELPEAFPDKIGRMHDLRASNARFARLEDEYHGINREIHRVETNIEPRSDFDLENMKKRRLALLDEIARIVNQA